MALFRFGNMDDMFGNIDNMMNQMMGGMFDPFAMTPFGRPGQNMMSPFNHMNQFQNMFSQASQMQANPGTSFVSSSFISYSSNGNQPPQVYEETKMNHVGPSGVREERHTVRDSRTGLQKMKVGRHIQDRGHVMERSRNNYTGDEEENNEFINIEEEEAPQFQQEWSSRMSRAYPNGQQQQYLQQAPQRTRLAITAGPSNDNHYQYQSTQSPGPIITHPPSTSPPPSANLPTSNNSNSYQYYHHDSPSSSNKSSKVKKAKEMKNRKYKKPTNNNGKKNE